ncbi:hypothetical protein BCR34DRAFT_553735 [Clohesyomyces aquaticus]|uniref:Uncharacterized protein n=1 Tax=Clohesyomyces aquaticus TaxID=1231657 RepID=A0A1Y2A872_9PLEO|nr:hypothetical protein BCR34DRAFT_553735 [Clohesyomyces aquaticus]
MNERHDNDSDETHPRTHDGWIEDSTLPTYYDNPSLHFFFFCFSYLEHFATCVI